jgi:hypothetical protein
VVFVNGSKEKSTTLYHVATTITGPLTDEQLDVLAGERDFVLSTRDDVSTAHAHVEAKSIDAAAARVVRDLRAPGGLCDDNSIVRVLVEAGIPD